MKVNKCAFAVVGIICLILLIYNLKFHFCTFFNANFVDLINILLVFLVTVFFANINSNYKRKLDAIERIILEIRKNIVNDDIISNSKHARSLQKSCSNKIKYLKECNINFIRENIIYIQNELEEIKELYENHINKGLHVVIDDINRHRDNIIDKCDKIQIELYKN